MSAALQAAPFFVIGDGQSIIRAPSDSDNFLIGAMADFPTVNYHNAAVLGANTVVLTSTIDDRVTPYAGCATTTILLLSHGTSDCAFGNHTGQQLYDEQAAYADLARTKGIDLVLATTLVRSEALMSAGDNTNRTDFNTLLLAAAGGAVFDAVADLAADATLADYTNDANYPDGLHFSSAAAAAAAAVVSPVLATLLA